MDGRTLSTRLQRWNEISWQNEIYDKTGGGDLKLQDLKTICSRFLSIQSVDNAVEPINSMDVCVRTIPGLLMCTHLPQKYDIAFGRRSNPVRVIYFVFKLPAKLFPWSEYRTQLCWRLLDTRNLTQRPEMFWQGTQIRKSQISLSMGVILYRHKNNVHAIKLRISPFLVWDT